MILFNYILTYIYKLLYIIFIIYTTKLYIYIYIKYTAFFYSITNYLGQNLREFRNPEK